MTTPYHKLVEQGIILLGEEWKCGKKVGKILRGNEHPLSIVDSQSKYVVNYQPDVYFVLRNNKKLIFEVLDSQEEKQDQIIADVIESILVENVEGIIFVFPGGADAKKRILEALVTITRGLLKKGVRTSEIPAVDKSGCIAVPKTTNTAEAVKNILADAFASMK